MNNILIVEDNGKQRESIVKMIQEIDMRLNVYEAESNEESIKILEETLYKFFL